MMMNLLLSAGMLSYTDCTKSPPEPVPEPTSHETAKKETLFHRTAECAALRSSWLSYIRKKESEDAIKESKRGGTTVRMRLFGRDAAESVERTLYIFNNYFRISDSARGDIQRWKGTKYRQRHVNHLVSQAEGLTVADSFLDFPDIVLIGWEHHPEGGRKVTEQMIPGLELMYKTFQTHDILLPEGYQAGTPAEINPPSYIFRENYDGEGKLPFLLSEGKSRETTMCPLEAAIVDADETIVTFCAERTSIFVAGADSTRYLGRLFTGYEEGYRLWRERGKSEERRQNFLHHVRALTPSLREDQLERFDEIRSCMWYFALCEQSDAREQEYLIPTLLGLASLKEPGQVIYVPWGAAHITRGKITDALKQAGIAYVAFVTEGLNFRNPECD